MKKLTKSNTDIVLAGVLGGIAEYFELDPTLVRVGYVILSFVAIGAPVLLYILLAIIIPKAPKGENRRKEREARKERVDRAFSESNPVNETSSRQTQPIEDDDWSDF